MTDPIPEHRRMRGRLAIPYLTAAGVVSMAFRCIEDHKCGEVPHAKYLNPSGQLAHLYGVQSYFNKGMDIALTEGEINEITATEMCGIPTMSCAGAGKWQPWWGRVLADFRHVYVLMDGDAGGEQFYAKLAKEMGDRAVPVPFPAGEDVNSLYLKKGADHIRGMVYSS